MLPRHVFICVADHYEPFCNGASPQLARERVERWVRDYPTSVAGLSDSRGRMPQHSFFYPAEEYDPDVVETLAALCRSGLGEVEVHLHHDCDTSDHVRETLSGFIRQLSQRHGLLRRDAEGRLRFGFIHGNWALDNALGDGTWCGVNDEITILRELGCYADFTMPSAPAHGQTRTINRIYYATDDPQSAKSHDQGRPARVGQAAPNDGLLMIQGPLRWNWRQRKWGLMPRLENGDLHGANIPSMSRFLVWLDAAVRVDGRPDWVFVKLHTHGAMEMNSNLFLAGPARQFHLDLADYVRQHPGLSYYYVTAREMADLVAQAERGCETPEWPY